MTKKKYPIYRINNVWYVDFKQANEVRIQLDLRKRSKQIENLRKYVK